MDPVRNPYAPGAGSPPPELAGRGEIREDIKVRLERLRLGRPAKSMMLIGLRGVGKTVLLDQMRRDAEAVGIHTVRIEAPENRSLPAILAPALRLALLHLSKRDAAKDLAIRGLKALAGFAGKLKVHYRDIEVGLDYAPEPGLADNGDLELDLGTLLAQVGAAAGAAAGRGAAVPDPGFCMTGAEAERRAIGAAAGTAATGAADAPVGPPGGSVGSLIVGAAVGLGGKLMRTVSFLG